MSRVVTTCRYTSVSYTHLDVYKRQVLFLLYIWGIGLTKDIQRVFQYHGAEHKTIHTYELDLPLTVENVRQQSRLHARCGTNFLLIVMVVSIFVFAFLGWPNLLERILSRVLLMPVVAGIAYEVIRLAGRSEHSFVKAHLVNEASCKSHEVVQPVQKR